MSKPYIRVAAGVIVNKDHQVLLAQRPDGKPWSGWWEFPGGKIEENESVESALARELEEEINAERLIRLKIKRLLKFFKDIVITLFYTLAIESKNIKRNI